MTQALTRKRQLRHHSNLKLIEFGPSPIKDALFFTRWYYESMALLFGVDKSELWPTQENKEFSFHDPQTHP